MYKLEEPQSSHTPWKCKKTKIDISSKWENQLPLYLDLYSKLNDEGKKEMQRQLTLLGRLVDAIQQKGKKCIKK